MKICEEMVKLREGLDKRNILWADAGLLELRIDDNNPQGWLNAKEILDIVDKA